MATGVSGAILAGGLSTRMGADKAALMLAGRPLADWVASRLRPVCEEILWVGGSLSAPEGCRITPDAHPQRCSLTGLYSALTAARFPLVLVVACDYPLLSQQLLDRLIRSWRPGLLGLVPLGPQGPHPLLALYHRDLATRLRQSLDAGRFKISRAMDPRRQAYLPWASLQRLGVRAEELWNLNTPHELDRARRFLEGNKNGSEDQDCPADHQ